MNELDGRWSASREAAKRTYGSDNPIQRFVATAQGAALILKTENELRALDDNQQDNKPTDKQGDDNE